MKYRLRVQKECILLPNNQQDNHFLDSLRVQEPYNQEIQQLNKPKRMNMIKKSKSIYSKKKKKSMNKKYSLSWSPFFLFYKPLLS